MTTSNPTYHHIKGAITKDYAKKVIELVQEHGLIKSHVFDNFEGIRLDYDLIDPEGHIRNLIKYAEKYFQENYSIPGRDFFLTRSYGTIMNPKAFLDVHKDHYNSGREHDFSYGDALVCNLYMSDDYEGGELIFPDINGVVKAEMGDAVLFPGYLLRHGVNEVRSGRRISFLNHFSLLSEEDTKIGKKSK